MHNLADFLKASVEYKVTKDFLSSQSACWEARSCKNSACQSVSRCRSYQIYSTFSHSNYLHLCAGIFTIETSRGTDLWPPGFFWYVKATPFICCGERWPKLLRSASTWAPRTRAWVFSATAMWRSLPMTSVIARRPLASVSSTLNVASEKLRKIRSMRTRTTPCTVRVENNSPVASC